MSTTEYQLLNLKNGNTYSNEYILKTPKTRQIFPTYEQAKTAFNAMRKAKKWVLFHSINGDLTVYVNHSVSNPACVLSNKIPNRSVILNNCMASAANAVRGANSIAADAHLG